MCIHWEFTERQGSEKNCVYSINWARNGDPFVFPRESLKELIYTGSPWVKEP